MDLFNNLDFWARDTHTPSTSNMIVNKFGRCDDILFTVHDYNILISLSTKYIENKQYLQSFKNGRSLGPKSNFQTVSEIRGGRNE